MGHGHIRRYLESATNLPRFLAEPRKLPERLDIEKSNQALDKKFSGTGDIPPQEELAEVAARLLEATDRNQLAAVSNRDWRKAAWCLWLKGIRLIDIPEFRDSFISRLRLTKRRSDVKRLIGAYLRDFDPEDQSFQDLGRVIRSLIDEWQWIWPQRHRNFRLFEATEAPERIARNIYIDAGRLTTTIEHAGLASAENTYGMSSAVHSALLRQIRRALEKDELKTGNLRLLLNWSGTPDGGLKFAGSGPKLAEALLAPWVSREPPAELKEHIQTFMLDHLGDPRIRTGKNNWQDTPEPVKGVLRRWLVGNTLTQFFEVVDSVAKISQWRYRRSFWGSYYKANVITDAWVAFGWQGYAEARRSFENQGGFARLDGGSPEHAVLILRIGDLTIADWSHNGKCRIWRSNNRTRPEPYQLSYTRQKLMKGSDFDQIHYAADNGTWQREVVQFVRDETGINIPRSEYMP